MTTGLTPTIDSLNAYKHCWLRFGSGTAYDEVNRVTASLHSSSYMTRGGVYINGTYLSVVDIPDFYSGAPINVFVRAKLAEPDGTLNPVIVHKANTSTLEGFIFRIFHTTSSGKIFASQYCTDNSLVLSGTGGTRTIKYGVFSVSSLQCRSNSADGVQCFIDGVPFDSKGSTIGKTIRHCGSAARLRILGYAPTQNSRGIVSDILIFQNVILTEYQHYLIASELNNEIRYGYSPLVINNGYGTIGTSVWEARYGILADEKTMTAGNVIGYIDEFKVISGSFKMTTEMYGSVLAKVISCVTNGTVRLPDPRPELGTTFAFKKYTGGAWTDATSGSTDIALTAGEKILWATQDASVCLRKY